MARFLPTRLRRLDRDFFRRDPVTVARELLGKRLVHRVSGRTLAGFIVETEAYLGKLDRASHSFGGRRTTRTETMYGDGGTAYVFLNYGLHHLFNIVTDTVDLPTAVLIRAVQPSAGLKWMWQNRLMAKTETQLCSGPGKLTSAFNIDRSHDGCDLVTSQSLLIDEVSQSPVGGPIVAAPRIGVDYALEWATRRLRFYLRDNPHVSHR